MASLVFAHRPRRHQPLPRRSLMGAAVALALAQHGAALAGPTGAQVAAGQVSVTNPSAAQTVVSQSSDAAIVNWRGFSVGAVERVDFRQPGAASVILNRVGGGSPSEIYGQLTANGKVFLVNPSGVLFGRGAQVDVGGLVASTLDIGDADFLAGRYRFTGTATSAGVANMGRIGAAERGTVALLGATVNNDGVINARLGTVAMAAGNKITIDFNGDGLTKLRVDEGTLRPLVANRGMVVADGGQAIMTAQAAQGIADTVLEQQGVVRAQSLVERNGRILLDGGPSGVTLVGGTLDVSGAAPGRSGGEAHLLGHHVGLVGNALVDARGDAGGGSILVGGDAHGANPAVRNAEATYAGPATRLHADALGAGAGGKVVLWSDQATRVFGTVSAAGGLSAGDGGFIETSGKFLDIAGANIGAPARAGAGARAGNWLLDPFDVTIAAAVDTAGVSPGPDFVSNAPFAQIASNQIVTALDAGTSVSVTTGAGGPATGGFGDINVIASLEKTTGANTTLTLNAARDINIFADPQTGLPVTIGAGAGGGMLNVDLNADSDGVGGGAIFMNTGTSITTNGGNVRMYGQGDAVNGRASGRPIAEASNSGVGVYLAGTFIDTTAAGGAVSAGNILIRGQAAAEGGTGVRLVGTRLATGGGSIGIDGLAGTAGTGVSIGTFDSTDSTPDVIRTNSGPVTITGRGASNGVELGLTDVGVNIPPVAEEPGLAGAAATVTAAGPNEQAAVSPGAALTVTGTGGTNGISLLNSTLGNPGGSIALTGFGGLNDGVVLTNTGVSAQGNGAIDIRGRTGGGNSAFAGVAVSASTIATANGNGRISISGEAASATPGIFFDDGTVIGGAGTSGDITLRALNAGSAEGGSSDMIVLAGTIRSSGALNVLPGGVSETGALAEAPTVPVDLFAATTNFSLDAAELTGVIQPGFARVTIGSASHTGPITAAAGAPFGGAYDLTLQNGGAGSEGITLPDGLSNPGRLTILSSGGPVTQGGPIASGSLLLHGTQPQSRFLLTAAANAVGRFSAHVDQGPAPGLGTVSFVNSGDLDIGPLAGAGFDAATDAPQPIAAPDAVAGGDLFLQTSRDLILNQNISTLGSNITLVAGGVLRNIAGATLAPGGNGAWTVFADTWVGEQPGPLAGTGPTPNLFNCAYGAPCAATLPAGNHFVYRQQPRVDVALIDPNPARLYGSDNPAFAFTATGLVKGDTPAAALGGAYTTSAIPTSNVQSYPINGSFSSPAGYLVVAAPGTLRVDPATLTYVAAPAARLAGSPNPPLTGSVTGLVAGDTLAGATTGTPVFTTTADAATAPGQYAITGGGLSAVNYVFRQAPENATALAVLPRTVLAVFRPDPQRDVSFASTALYGENIGLQRSCAGTGPLARADASSDARDPLAVEWSRVRDNPNLSNCIGLVRRYSCDSF